MLIGNRHPADERQKMENDDLREDPLIAARRDLVRWGFVEDSGERRNGQIVWRLTPLGLELSRIVGDD
jgi:hypothetical protein